MLALVHPFNQPQDALNRPPSSSSVRSRQQSRRPLVPSASSLPLSSSSRPSSVAHSSLHRHSTAAQPPLAPLSVHKHQPQRPPTPPPKVIRASTPPPPPTITPPSHQSNPFDIHSYPSPELLRLLATLLTQIAATNDKLEAASPTAPAPDPPSTTPTRTSLSSVTDQDAPIWRTLTTASRTAISTPSSTLTFHARNIPTISLEAYLLRILKYCPTTNEVFLSLLVYFDRMSKISAEATGRTFVIDSYNIHRLVIAGVTVASKFFSDVFYTNSRYAKVGGLPQAELNQLELQFLLLNDFRLVIPGDEMQRYAEQLILFSTSESTTSPVPSLSSSPSATAPLARPAGGVSAPMQAMGAIDAYGGRIPGEDAYGHRNKDKEHKPFQHYLQPGANGFDHTNSRSHAHNPMYNNHHHHHPPSASSSFNASTTRTPHARPRYDTETETETETEAGETDGGETTDDEPTIRPAHSTAGSEDNRSLCSVGSQSSNSGAEDTGDEGGDEDDGGFGDDEKDGFDDEAEEMDVEGDRTPERKRSMGERGDLTPERRIGGVGRARLRDGDRDQRMASP